MNEGLLSDLELARARWPGISDADLVQRLAEQTLDELDVVPPIDPNLVASFRGIARIEEVPLAWAGCLTHEAQGVVARIRMSDARPRRRFTAFHEIEHTYLPGFAVTQFRCDPLPAEKRRGITSTPVELLADLGASELLLPRRFVQPDLLGNGMNIELVQALADRYDASLEATALRAITLADRDALAVCLVLGTKPSAPADEPALRVRWSKGNGSWPFVPRHKSAPPGSPFDRALAGEIVDEVTTIRGLTSEPIERVHVSAQLVPFTDAQRVTHMRVLALLTRARLGSRAA